MGQIEYDEYKQSMDGMKNAQRKKYENEQQKKEKLYDENLQKAMEQTQSLKNEIDKILKSKGLELKKLQNENEEMMQKYNDLHEDYEQNLSELKCAKKRIEQLLCDNDNVEIENDVPFIHERQRTITPRSTTKFMDFSNEIHDHLKVVNEELEDEIEKLTIDLQVKTQKNKELQSQNQVLSEDLHKIKIENDEKAKESSKYSEDLGNLQIKYDEINTKCIKNEIDLEFTHVIQFEEEKESKIKYDSFSDEKEELINAETSQSKLTSFAIELKKALKNDELKKKLDALKIKNDEYCAENKALIAENKKNGDIQTKYDVLNEKYKKLKQKHDALKDRISILQKSENKLKQKNEEQSIKIKQNKKNEDRTKSLQDEIAQITKELNKEKASKLIVERKKHETESKEILKYNAQQKTIKNAIAAYCRESELNQHQITEFKKLMQIIDTSDNQFVRQRLKGLHTKYEQMKKSQDQIDESLNALNKQHQDQMNALKAENSDLSVQLIKETKKTKEFEQKFIKSSDALNFTMDKLKQSDTASAKCVENINEIQTKYDKLLDENKRLKQKFDKQSKASELKNECIVIGLNEQIKSLQKQMKIEDVSHQKAIEALQKKCKKFEASQNKFDAVTQSKAEEIKKLQNEMNLFQNNHNEIEKDFKNFKIKYGLLLIEKEKLIKNEVSRSEQDEIINIRMDELKKELDALKIKNRELMEQNEALIAENKKNKDVQTKYDELNAKYKTLANEYNELKQKHNALKKRNHEIVKGLEDRINVLQESENKSIGNALLQTMKDSKTRIKQNKMNERTKSMNLEWNGSKKEINEKLKVLQK